VKILCVFGEHSYGDPKRGAGYEFTNFIPSLRRLGHEVVLFDSFNRFFFRDFSELNSSFLKAVEDERPDLIFCVLMGYELWIETLDMVRSSAGAVLVNWGTDDSWKYWQFSRFVAPHFDLYATTYPEALTLLQRNGCKNAILTQWGANSEALMKPIPASKCRYNVSFVGAAYGNRRRWIESLLARGIHVDCFGHGWNNGVIRAEEIPGIIRQSVISLNFSESDFMVTGFRVSPRKQIKARVFEVTGCGGFLMTEYAEGLNRYFLPEMEIATFKTVSELAEKIRHFLEHPQERDKTALLGHTRTLREHTYEERFRVLLRAAGLNRTEDAKTVEQLESRRIDFSLFDALAERHKTGFFLRCLRRIIVAPCRLIWGPARGSRAARRIVFEFSWRLLGHKTYTASGLPGRLFYHES
jgi:spore maturation protein CgeB